MTQDSLYNFIINPQKALKNHKPMGEIPNPKQVVKETLTVASYSIIESLSSAVVMLIDMAMVGTISSSAIAAIGLTTQPKFIILALFFAFYHSVVAIVARRFGEGNQQSANDCMMQSISLTIFFGIILCTLGYIFSRDIMLLVGALPDTIDDATIYFKIIVITNLFVALTLMINGSQRGIGNTKITLITSLIANGVNVCFNYLLIGGNLGFPRLEVLGAGIATLIGQVIAFMVALYSVTRKNGYLQFQFKKLFTFTKSTLRAMKPLVISASVEQVFLRVGFLLFAIIVANLGTDAFAAHQIGMSVITISFAIGDGIGIASASLVGQSLGRQRPDMAVIYSKTCQKIGFILSVVLALIFFIFPVEIYKLFSAPDNIIEMGKYIITITGIITCFQIQAVISGGSLRGAGDVKFIAIMSFIAITIIRPILGYLLCFPMGLGLFGVWVALLCDQFTRFILIDIRFKKGKWLTIRI